MKTARIVFIFVMLAAGTSCEVKPVAFDSATWKAGDASVRRSMAQDISNRNLLNGMSRNEVIKLLGPPDHTDMTFLAYDVDDSSVIVRSLLGERVNMIVGFNASGETVEHIGFADR